ncbi:lys-63-specific deubiquitinase BRCC36 isoform X1 [Colius striatus]|uniref:lys-63-specific deubiquitinase BRCC36 isoform X1 n=1 Tax=Colius striatus TaxID=57412 RepID=UPI002B1CEB72|nr:lys-63-specific deubiquitinase BRCC36 isoform X1 [Colius striatus]
MKTQQLHTVVLNIPHFPEGFGLAAELWWDSWSGWASGTSGFSAGWEGALELIQHNPLPKQLPPRSGHTGTCPVSWEPPEQEPPHPPWAAWARAPSLGMFQWNCLCCSFIPSPLVLALGTTERKCCPKLLTPTNVRTQAMYQMMDQGFVGLIFSCFIEDKNTKTGRILYTCFQSIQAQKSSEYERIEIPIHVVPHETIGKVCLESAVELPKILCQEEQDAYRRIHSLTHLDSVTKIHNGSVFTKNLCSQMSAISGPLLQWLEDRLEQNKQRVQELQQEKEQLLEELAALE